MAAAGLGRPLGRPQGRQAADRAPGSGRRLRAPLAFLSSLSSRIPRLPPPFLPSPPPLRPDMDSPNPAPAAQHSAAYTAILAPRPATGAVAAVLAALMRGANVSPQMRRDGSASARVHGDPPEPTTRRPLAARAAPVLARCDGSRRTLGARSAAERGSARAPLLVGAGGRRPSPAALGRARPPRAALRARPCFQKHPARG